jgi:3-deoxy-7-phosphoheptulonate synthase
MALASVASGADALMIEVHNKPETALSDGEQSLIPDRFAALVKQMRAVAEAIGREV